MPRQARISKGGLCYHVMNRGNERRTIFHDDNEYASFLQLLHRASEHQPMRVLAFCLMPNHFHLCLWPKEDDDLSRYMQWLTTTHIKQYRKSHPGDGHVWQGRFKSFSTQSGRHLYNVLRYIERNPLRAGLAERANEWPWSSAGLSTEYLGQQGIVLLHSWPVAKPEDWLEQLQSPDDENRLEHLRQSVKSGKPYGDAAWVAELES